MLHITFSGPITVQLAATEQVSEILSRLTNIEKTIKEIKMTEQDFLVVLKQVDDTTTKIGSNISTIGGVVQGEADTIQTIKTEVDALVAAQQQAGVSQTIVDATKAIAAKLQTSSDTSDAAVTALNAQVPVLQGIAAAGAPVVPPPPPPPSV